MASNPITLWQIDGGKNANSDRLYFLGLQNQCRQWMQPWLLLGREAMTNLESILKNRDIILPTKVHTVRAMVFPGITYRCHSWTIKKAERWRTDAFELWCWRRLLQSPLDLSDIKPVNPKGNQCWMFTGRTDAKAEAPIHWPPDVKNQLTGKDLDAGKD